MNHPPRPTPGLFPVVCDTRPPAKIIRVEHGLSTKADCALAWKIFADCKRWRRFSNAYRSIEWQGEPWVPGSRLQIEVVRPVRAIQDRVITVCTPARCVAWINHVLGYTMEQWVLFDPGTGGGTLISTWIEITGADLEGHDIENIVTRFVSEWFVNFGAECDRVANT